MPVQSKLRYVELNLTCLKNKKMKIKIAYLFLFVCNFLAAQSGVVKYNFQGLAYDKASIKDDIDAYLSQIVDYANKQEFELSFSKNRSSFVYLDRMKDDLNFNVKIENIAKSLHTSKNVFVDFHEKVEITQQNDGTLVKTNLIPLQWEISTDSKKIGNYLCYKAILKTKFVNKSGEMKVKECIAWFAPSLPYSYGPKNFSGLPGLILEISENQKTFMATNIELFDKEIKITFPKGKTVDKEVYIKKLNENIGATLKR